MACPRQGDCGPRDLAIISLWSLCSLADCRVLRALAGAIEAGGISRETRYDFSALVGQMRYKFCQPAPTRKRPYSTSVLASIPSNNCVRKLDWGSPLNNNLMKVAFSTCSRWDNPMRQPSVASGGHAVCQAFGISKDYHVCSFVM